MRGCCGGGVILRVRNSGVVTVTKQHQSYKLSEKVLDKN